ncbi:hypothetical protein A0H81_01611 [Grifola frondosa]|uniref:Uncharacterized protein n=1 Tax=Grifola frondosa TaxID=5627 RepID=A0A1C7MSC4_GRIFR|nr:hypothetical protein A0H81_01611 [Grifola frondosa]
MKVSYWVHTGAPTFPFGAPLPPLQQLYNPLCDPSLSLEQTSTSLFFLGIFILLALAFHNVIIPGALEVGIPLWAQTGSHIPPTSRRTPMVKRMTAAELAAVTDASVMGSHIAVLHISPEMYSESLQLAMVRDEPGAP